MTQLITGPSNPARPLAIATHSGSLDRRMRFAYPRTHTRARAVNMYARARAHTRAKRSESTRGKRGRIRYVSGVYDRRTLVRFLSPDFMRGSCAWLIGVIVYRWIIILDAGGGSYRSIVSHWLLGYIAKSIFHRVMSQLWFRYVNEAQLWLRDLHKCSRVFNQTLFTRIAFIYLYLLKT